MSHSSQYYANQIEIDLQWREKELAVLRKQLIQTAVNSPQEVVFLRTNLAMIYAHYEGFCKFALGVYIDALENLALKRRDLKWEIAARSLAKFHKELRAETKTETFFRKMLTDFDSHLDSPATYERPDRIANLWPDLLTEWLTGLGLNSSIVTAKHATLHSLVNDRNQIAHGKKLTVANRGELFDRANAAMLAMHEVAVEIVDALDNRKFFRHAKVMTIVGHAI